MIVAWSRDSQAEHAYWKWIENCPYQIDHRRPPPERSDSHYIGWGQVRRLRRGGLSQEPNLWWYDDIETIDGFKFFFFRAGLEVIRVRLEGELLSAGGHLFTFGCGLLDLQSMLQSYWVSWKWARTSRKQLPKCRTLLLRSILLMEILIIQINLPNLAK